jgi:hypothetical protein
VNGKKYQQFQSMIFEKYESIENKGRISGDQSQTYTGSTIMVAPQ